MSSGALVGRLPGSWLVSRPISRLRRLPFREGGHPRWGAGARIVWQGRVGERNRAGELGEQLVLRAQLQMQVQQDDEADADPHIEDKIRTPANSHKLRHTRGMRGNPDEVETDETH